MSSRESLWQHAARMPEFPALTGDLQTDVLIIGGGLAGLLTAHGLKERGIDTVLVEQNRLCGGTTGHTTAKITAQHGLCYHKLLQALGPEGAGLYYRANTRAVEALKDLCKQADCPLEEKDNFVYSPDRRKIQRELEALEKLGIPAIFRQTLPIPLRAEAVGFENQGQFHPFLWPGFWPEG